MNRLETPSDWQLELSGLIADKSAWTIDKLRALPQEVQVRRHSEDLQGFQVDRSLGENDIAELFICAS